jgi:hypothetical protein
MSHSCCMRSIIDFPKKKHFCIVNQIGCMRSTYECPPESRMLGVHYVVTDQLTNLFTCCVVVCFPQARSTPAIEHVRSTTCHGHTLLVHEMQRPPRVEGDILQTRRRVAYGEGT